MKHYQFKPSGVCSTLISFDIDNDKIYNLNFTGGCNGNLKAIGILLEGMNCQEIINKLQGNTCGFKKTSCADQLTLAIKNYMEEK